MLIKYKPVAPKKYTEYCKRKKKEYGNEFSDKDLAQQFAPYLHTKIQIVVKDTYKQTHTGFVGVTTGWRPSFLLLDSIHSCDSDFLLQHEDTIIAIKIADTYIPIRQNP